MAEETSSMLFTGEWWISVVIAGLLINLAAAYLKPTIDTWVASRSKKKKEKLEKEKEEELKIIEKLTSSPTSAIELRVERSRSLLKLILYIVLALLVRDITSILFQGEWIYRMNFGINIPWEARDVTVFFAYFIILVLTIIELNFIRRSTKLLRAHDKSLGNSWLS